MVVGFHQMVLLNHPGFICCNLHSKKAEGSEQNKENVRLSGMWSYMERIKERSGFRLTFSYVLITPQ